MPYRPTPRDITYTYIIPVTVIICINILFILYCADKMEQWNEAKRKYQESDSDSGIGTSHMSTTKSDCTEVQCISIIN